MSGTHSSKQEWERPLTLAWVVPGARWEAESAGAKDTAPKMTGRLGGRGLPVGNNHPPVQGGCRLGRRLPFSQGQAEGQARVRRGGVRCPAVPAPLPTGFTAAWFSERVTSCLNSPGSTVEELFFLSLQLSCAGFEVTHPPMA